MDGVLADFVTGVESPEFLNGPLTHDAEYDLRKLELSNKGLFAKLPKMPDMDKLINHIKDSGEYWEILTATGNVNRAVVAKDKNKWIREHVDPDVLITCTIKGKDKAVFAKPNHILIDDRLCPLYQSSFPKIKVLKKSEKANESLFDYHIPICSLGLFFRNFLKKWSIFST